MKNQTFGTEIEVNRISRQAAARAIAGVLSTDGYTAEVRHEGMLRVTETSLSAVEP